MKWETLKTLVHRTCETCATDEYLRDEINNYPHRVISKVFKETETKPAYQRNVSQGNNNEDQKQHLIVLPYKGQKETSC